MILDETKIPSMHRCLLILYENMHIFMEYRRTSRGHKVVPFDSGYADRRWADYLRFEPRNHWDVFHNVLVVG